jgi:hypothetical protein
MSNLHSHALAEFRAAGWTDIEGNYSDEMQEAMCKHVLKLLDVFADEGHSGSTAPYAVQLFEKLAMFKPIVPLTGEDWEWHEASEGVFQNKRCSRVFKQVDRFDGQAYDIDGRVFYEWVERELDPDEEGYPGKRRYKSHYTSRESMVPITFPYTPTTEYVEATGDNT